MALLARGGVIGGTSAGAAIMSRMMIVSGRTEAKLGQGFDFLPGAVIDQHFLKRNRIKRLLGVVRSHPDLIGLGIDESTALVVDVRGKRLHVIGNSYVIACVPETSIATPGDPPSARQGHDSHPLRDPQAGRRGRPRRLADALHGRGHHRDRPRSALTGL